ncbi:GTP 3',8-cyclase, mitochondrial isoform X1 [Physcomitrium patens]|nr:GTP 3',8-cyclase, mitochondrial-like isoform X1 [Physcomitrium patens]XP_024378972.1 GTP 3',8-cyclase, mitochondrial-like isoform X1 [Physcomitrium patens]|eukprot:XP_024378971.1 GTP 3',8-cyclase, mitochondrial-like isoform X1 [Physcomitrella patens]
MRWVQWVALSSLRAARSLTTSSAPTGFGFHQGYSGVSAVVCKQGSVVSFHALALEKEPQPEDERRDGEVDRHSNEKPRSDNLREKSSIEGVSPVRSSTIEADPRYQRRHAEEADRVSDMLTDSHGRRHNYLRISLTERCNLRCHYCMPAEGVELTPNSGLLSQEEIIRIASTFVAGGVDKIRLTGGEPSIRSDIEEICEQLRSLPGLQNLAMTSNGIILSRKLFRLQAAGLNQLNISLDTLVPAKFELLTRRKGHNKVLQSIDTALGLGFSPVKVNTVVMRGLNDDEILDFVEITRDRDINVRFIEFMPFDGNVWNPKKLVSYVEMMDTIKNKFPSIYRLKDHPTDTAKNFRVEGYLGTVSFITSMTQHFCSGCNRLRLMADGNLKVCLFGPSEVSLRDAVRSGMQESELQQVISDAVKRKKAAHAGMFELARTQNRPMIHIGG